MILKDKTTAEIHLMTHRAVEVIRARDRSIRREHADRLRRLTDLMREISVSDFDNTDGETMPGTNALSLSPELEKLILNPTEGL